MSAWLRRGATFLGTITIGLAMAGSAALAAIPEEPDEELVGEVCEGGVLTSVVDDHGAVQVACVAQEGPTPPLPTTTNAGVGSGSADLPATGSGLVGAIAGGVCVALGLICVRFARRAPRRNAFRAAAPSP
jgi:hypothetical protein